MATASTIYTGELRTSSTHLKSGNTLVTDAPTDNHGKGETFSPTDLVATALGACMLTVMGIWARTADIDLTDTQIETTKVMGNNPRRVSEIHVNFQFPASLQLTEAQQTKLKEVALNCPVAKSLSTDLKQMVTFSW
ncbi:OsmC family protein [Microscilla marina]|uniref:Redox protein n=1 Tax=Microscilla marina ATCC 23134 TaxID=313606 RepID=A1ZYD4_MICM2|nr:OsmC family protein [Microscilla marina]EAY24607.1 redox protein [Microscilla marina ATCC 23134]